MKYGYFKSHTYQHNGGLGEIYADLRSAGAEVIYYDYYRNSSPYWNRLLKKLKEHDVLYIDHLYDLDIRQRDYIIVKHLKKLKELKVRVFIQDVGQVFQEIDIEKEKLPIIKDKLLKWRL